MDARQSRHKRTDYIWEHQRSNRSTDYIMHLLYELPISVHIPTPFLDGYITDETANLLYFLHKLKVRPTL